MEIINQVFIEILNCDTKPGCINPAIIYKVAHNSLCPVYRYGKPYALSTGIDGGIDAYEFAIDIKERATTVSGIDRGIYLDKIMINTTLCPHRSVKGAYHTGCYCVRETKWIAYGNDGLSYHKVI